MMAWFADLPIRTKLLLASALTSGIALLFAGVVIVAYESYDYGPRKARDLAAQADTLAASAAAAVAFNDAKAAMEYLRAYDANPDITGAAIYGADGRPLARHARGGAAAGALPATAEPPGERAGGGAVEVFRPVRDGSRLAGTVYLRAGLESLPSRLLRYGGLILLVLVVSLLVTLPLSLRLQRTIAQPIQEMSQAASLIAHGDLTVALPARSRRDEVGVMVDMFSLMAERLREQIRGLVEGATVIGGAASEIVASTSQLTASASEAAAVVSETSATVEQVRQSTEVASLKARSVAESAQRVAQISQDGRKSTEDVAAGMARIRDQMDAIAASMVRLAEQGRAIDRIMATVEDLAAQSNLLAVNAAIEAAKAGEHGKGFAVVAQEVKSLAMQSRQATVQVRGILGDIQQATNSAMAATRQGSAVVGAGTLQTERAAEAIRELATSVSEAAQAATQIAASSQQQLIGVAQVAGAMESVRQGSVQNVAGAKQLDASARNLDELGRRLKEMVALYKV